MKRILLSLLAIPLVGCGTMFHQNALTVTASTNGQFQQGHVHDTTFTVTNTSKWPILVTDLVPESNEDETSFAFQRQYYGSTQNTGEAAVSYNANAQQATDRIFNEGLLLEGQSMQFTKTHRVLDPVEKFRIHYVVVDTPRGISDLGRRIYLPGSDGVYTHPTDDRLNQFKTGTFPIVTGGTAPSPRAVLFPEGKFGKSTTAGLLYRDDVVEITFAPKLLPETREAASIKAGVSAYAVVAYSEALNGWIAHRGSDRFLIPNGGEKKQIPDVSALLYKDVDHTGEALVSVDEPATFTAMGFKMTEGNAQYTPGMKFITVTRENLATFLAHESLQGPRTHVEPVYYFFDSHYFKITRE
jgi:hypothetical protein